MNVIDNRIPGKSPDKLIGGALEQRFDSTSNETSTTKKLEGGQDHVIYHIDGFYRNHDFIDIGGRAIDTAAAAITNPNPAVVDNPAGYLKNTVAEEISCSAGLFWFGEPGFAVASINNLDNNYGIAQNGTGSYALGSQNLIEETSYNLNLGYRFKSDWLRAEFDLFHNWASNYTTHQRSGRFVNEDWNPCLADSVPLEIATQNDANFKGYEAKLIFIHDGKSIGLYRPYPIQRLDPWAIH